MLKITHLRSSLISFIANIHGNQYHSVLLGKKASVVYRNSNLSHSGIITLVEARCKGYRLTVENKNGIFTIETLGKLVTAYETVEIDGQKWVPSSVKNVKLRPSSKIIQIFRMATPGDMIYHGSPNAANEMVGTWWEVLSIVRKVQKSGTVLQLQDTDNPKNVIEVNAAQFHGAVKNPVFAYRIDN